MIELGFRVSTGPPGIALAHVGVPVSDNFQHFGQQFDQYFVAQAGVMPNPKVWGFWLAPGQKPSKFHHFANEPRPARWQVILYRNYWKAAHVAQIDDEEPGVPRDLEVTAANVIFKWITILLMGAFMIFISPKVLMRLGADSFGRLSQLCQQGDEWDMAVDSMVRNLSGYDAAAELVQRGALISEWSDAILVNGTYGNDGALMVCTTSSNVHFVTAHLNLESRGKLHLTMYRPAVSWTVYCGGR